MPKKTDDRTPKTPLFLETARAFYADAFEHRRKKDLAAAMEEWADLHEAEQSFAVAHLLFLNLKAQADTLRVLVDLRELLDEVADGVDQVLDAEDDEHEVDDDAPSDDEDPNRDLVDDTPATDAASEPVAPTDETDATRGAA